MMSSKMPNLYGRIIKIRQSLIIPEKDGTGQRIGANKGFISKQQLTVIESNVLDAVKHLEKINIGSFIKAVQKHLWARTISVDFNSIMGLLLQLRVDCSMLDTTRLISWLDAMINFCKEKNSIGMQMAFTQLKVQYKNFGTTFWAYLELLSISSGRGYDEMLEPGGDGKEYSHTAANAVIVIPESVPGSLMGIDISTSLLTPVEQRFDDSTLAKEALRPSYEFRLNLGRGLPHILGGQSIGSEDNEDGISGEGGGGGSRSTNPINPALLMIKIFVVLQNGERRAAGEKHKSDFRTMEEFCSWVHQCWVDDDPGRQPAEVIDRQNLWPGHSLFLYDRHGPYNRSLDQIEDGWPFTVFIGALTELMLFQCKTRPNQMLRSNYKQQQQPV